MEFFKAGGQRFAHYGSPVTVKGRRVSVDPDPDMHIPSSAIVVCMDDGFKVLPMFAAGTPSPVAEIITSEIDKLATGKVLSDSLLEQLYAYVTTRLDEMVQEGLLARDYRGTWHAAIAEETAEEAGEGDVRH